MRALTVFIGACLAATGLIAYAVSDSRSWTAFIPSIVGVLLLITAAIARNENARPHAMHAALLIAVLGALGSLRNVMGLPEAISGDAERPLAVYSSTVMLVLLVIFVIAGIRSFVVARRARNA